MPPGVFITFTFIHPVFTVTSLGFVEPDNPARFNWITLGEEGADVFVSSDLLLSDFLNDPAVGNGLKRRNSMLF